MVTITCICSFNIFCELLDSSVNKFNKYIFWSVFVLIFQNCFMVSYSFLKFVYWDILAFIISYHNIDCCVNVHRFCQEGIPNAVLALVCEL